MGAIILSDSNSRPTNLNKGFCDMVAWPRELREELSNRRSMLKPALRYRGETRKNREYSNPGSHPS